MKQLKRTVMGFMNPINGPMPCHLKPILRLYSGTHVSFSSAGGLFALQHLQEK